ncbi:MAG: GAF domain-containing protein [Betaproteobacteria bacterium]
MARVTKPVRTKIAAKPPAARKSARTRLEPRPVAQRLKDALAQQAATSEVLRAISQSPTDVLPVFETIAANALRLCDAVFSVVYRFDGELIHVAAQHNVSAGGAAAFHSVYPCPPHEGGATQRAVLTGRVVHMPDIREDAKYLYKDAAEAADFRSVLSVPMLRGDVVLGAITVFRSAARLFPEAQVGLLETFAAQAVIAVENVRLFNETKARNRELTEALEQQTATSEILRLIAGTPTDTQPVFELLAQRAGKLCGAEVAVVSRYEGNLIELAAVDGVSHEAVEVVRKHYPLRIEGQTTLTARAIRDGVVVHSGDVLADTAYETRDFAQAANFRAGVAVPIIREGKVIGSIFAGRAAPGLFSDSQVDLLKTFADQAAIAIENVRLFKALDTRNTELSQSLERQTATSDILRVISQSPTDTQPVFDTIAEAVLKLCNARSAIVAEFDGELLTLAALANVDSHGSDAIRRSFPRRPGVESATARSVLTRDVTAIPDVLKDPDYAEWGVSHALGLRSILSVPLMREATPIGAISVWRTEPGAFPDDQVVLLKTFADQAVIAIENVRLFKALGARNADLTEALEQQTATSNILRVIGQSQTDAQPVFDTIVSAAMKLCNASSVNVLTYDGELIHLAALVNETSEGAAYIRRMWPQRPGRNLAAARAILTREVVCIPDVLEDAEFGDHAFALAVAFRSILAVPLVRDGEPVGAIAVGRPEPGPFPEEQVALLRTFADQAVIAIENVRLFTELQARNSDLTEALDQQTATSEILRVISASPRDAQPVFDAIASAALKLCAAQVAMVARYDGKLVELAAIANLAPGGEAALREIFPRPPGMDTTSCRAVLTGQVEMIADVLDDSHYKVGDQATRAGFRSTLAVPLMRGGQPIGCITVGRPEPGPYGNDEIGLLQTFADQAVIAIRNVQLFTELEARTAELSRSVGELKALGEVGQAVSSTLDVQTVLSTIVARANELAGMDGTAIYEYDEVHERFYLRTSHSLPDELVDALRADPIHKGEGALGRLAVTFEPVQVPDIVDAGSYQSHVRDTLVRLGYRSLLAIPLLRENHLLGGLVVNCKSAGEFAPQVSELLKTFASQSALAIQNARLFHEIADKSRQLEVASQHKSEFLANMSHELRTPLNAIIGFSEVLAERMFGEINDKQEEYLGDILDSARHLLSLINDILDLSKIEAGRMELNVSDFHLSAAIENTIMLMRERAHRRDITLSCVIDEKLGEIRADERKVKQVLLNLLSNALKFTSEGGRIDVRAAKRGDCVEISVADTGVGIALEDQATVFEEFRQVGSASKRVEGTGLGLAISRKFVELHGGAIRVESEPGKGSTFAFTIPLAIDTVSAPD